MSTSSETVGFPIYGAAFDPNCQLIYVVGGGGSSKSGVKNIIAVYKMIIEDSKALLTKVGETETGNGAPMNISIHNTLILCGVNDRCWMLEADLDDDPEGSDADPYQKVVKFAPDGSLFATSGSDGDIKVWKEGKKLLQIESGEVADLSFSPGSRRLYYVTNTTLVSYDLELKTSREIEAASKSFHFRCVLSLRSMLVVVENSVDRSKSQLVLRDAVGKSARFKLPVKKAVTSIAVDLDESCLAFGCADGTVGLFLLSSKKVILLKSGLHSFAVTSVQVATQNKKEFILISGSPDGNLKITRGRLGGSSRVGIILYLLLAIFMLLLAYFLRNDPSVLDEIILNARTLLKL